MFTGKKHTHAHTHTHTHTHNTGEDVICDQLQQCLGCGDASLPLAVIIDAGEQVEIIIIEINSQINQTLLNLFIHTQILKCTF
jgi:hypothetical protein